MPKREEKDSNNDKKSKDEEEEKQTKTKYSSELARLNRTVGRNPNKKYGY
jgi:hypothetical protein